MIDFEKLDISVNTAALEFESYQHRKTCEADLLRIVKSLLLEYMHVPSKGDLFDVVEGAMIRLDSISYGDGYVKFWFCDQ